MMFAMMAVMIPFMSTSVDAQSRYRTNRNNYSRNYDRYDDRYDDRSTYDKHRNRINIGVGTAAAALHGPRLGGTNGGLVGAAVGGGGTA